MPGLESPWHWLVLLVILLLLFGSKKLPEMGRSLGKGIREFKGTVSGLSLDANDETPPRAPVAPPPPAQVAPPKDRDTLSS
jgi:sec-independent protein translocase protein TatA